MSDLMNQALSLQPAAVAVVNAGSILPMQSAMLAQQKGLVEPVLVGDTDAIQRCAETLSWDISGLRICGAGDETEAGDAAAVLARDGEVAFLLKGDIHSDTLLRAVLKKEHGLRTVNRLSHAFHMSIPGRDKPLLITDAAMNVAPDVATRVAITRNAIDLMHALGCDSPAVAVLSAIEYVTPSMPSSADAAAVAAEFAGAGNAIVSGPLSLDVALSAEAASLKGMTDTVAGCADVLVVPTIETGNALFKSLVHFSSAIAAGIVLGAKVPVALTSRGDSIDSRLASLALCAVYAQSRC